MKKIIVLTAICLMVSATMFAAPRGKWLNNDEYQIKIALTNKANQSAARNAGINDAARQITDDFSEIIVKASKGKIAKPAARKIITDKYVQIIKAGTVSNEKYEPKRGTYLMIYTIKSSDLKGSLEKEAQGQ